MGHPVLHKDKALLALRNNFRTTKMFLTARFDCSIASATLGCKKSAAEWLMSPLFPPRKSYIISNMLGGNRVSFRDLILFTLNASGV